MVIRETSHIVAIGISHGSILALDCLPFEAGAIVCIKFVGNVPVVSEIEGELILFSLVVFRGVLVVVVEVVVALVGVEKANCIAAVVGDALVVHCGVGGVVDVVVPLVHTHTQSAVGEFLDKFRGEEHLVDVA